MGQEAIVFGPWAGEFGWELARWVPACRYIASNHVGKKYAIGPRGHGVLYEFVDEYIPFDKNFTYIPLMFRPTKCDQRLFNLYRSRAERLGRVIDPTLVRPKKHFRMEGKVYTGTQHKRIQDTTDLPIICVFPRQREHDVYRNWPIDNWIHTIALFCRAGYAVMAFGGPEDKRLDFEHKNYYDFIEYNEEDELDLCISALNLAQVGVTIQSGGFYASLYSCKYTIIFGIDRYVERVKKENITRSKYDYVVCKDFTFNTQFVVRKVIKSIRALYSHAHHRTTRATGETS